MFSQRSNLGVLLCVLQLLSAQAIWAADQSTIRVDSVVLRPMHAAEVPAQQTGLLQKIVVAEGEFVERGQLLAAMDDRQAKLAVARAEFELSQAEAKARNDISIRYADKALEVAKAELKRSSESIEQFPKSISQSQLDVERLTIEKLTLEREQAEHELELERYGVQLKQAELDAARLLLAQHQLTAPFDGTVVLVRGRVGEWVEVGDRVLRLVAVNRLRAEGFLPADQADSALVGKAVSFSAGSGDQEQQTTGIVRFVSPEMEPVSGQVRVWAEISNEANALRPGQQGTLVIEP